MATFCNLGRHRLILTIKAYWAMDIRVWDLIKDYFNHIAPFHRLIRVVQVEEIVSIVSQHKLESSHAQTFWASVFLWSPSSASLRSIVNLLLLLGVLIIIIVEA